MNISIEEFKAALAAQRELCLSEWKALGAARFTRYGSKKSEAAILNAPQPEIRKEQTT